MLRPNRTSFPGDGGHAHRQALLTTGYPAWGTLLPHFCSPAPGKAWHKSKASEGLPGFPRGPDHFLRGPSSSLTVGLSKNSSRSFSDGKGPAGVISGAQRRAGFGACPMTQQTRALRRASSRTYWVRALWSALGQGPCSKELSGCSLVQRVTSAVKGMEVTGTLPRSQGRRRSQSLALAPVPPPARTAPSPEARHTTELALLALPSLHSRTLSVPEFPAPRPAGWAPSSRQDPGVPLPAGSCGLGGGGAAAGPPRVAGSGSGLRPAPGPAPPQTARSRGARTDVSFAEVLCAGAGSAAGSVASLPAERSRSETRSPSSCRHGE